MRKSAILDIFHGVRGHMENVNIPQNMKNLDVICQTNDELKAKLRPEEFALHEKFASALEENYCDEIDCFFVEGFKLGLLIGLECTEKD